MYSLYIMSSKSNKSENIDTMSTSNKKITEFYKKNLHINFETINCLVIDFLEHMISDLSGSINNSITTKIIIIYFVSIIYNY